MQHVAIMRKSWGLTQKIFDGTKVIESRWYLHKYAPWGKIAPDDTIFFKDSGNPITLRANVKKVLSFEDLTPQKVQELLKRYGKEDGIEEKDIPEFYERFKNKNYCLLIYLKNVQKVKPFEINKKGFGAMAAWICIQSIEEIKKK
jgi:hypothetical protein